MKNSRLFKIVYRLLNDGKCSAYDLAYEHEVSVRTIYRDIDALSLAGIPIYATRGRNGGIEIMDDFIIDKNLLSVEEQGNILASLEAMAGLVPMEDDLILKLNSMWKQKEHSWISIDFKEWGSSKDNSDKFSQIRDAIINNKMISMNYLNAKNEDVLRRVHPVQLMYRSHAWYLYAFCELRSAMRLFKLNRIYDLEVLQETFDATYDVEYAIEIDYKDEEEVILCFHPSVAFRLYDEFNKDNIKVREDGYYVIHSNIVIDTWLYGYLLSYMGKVDVLQPKHLKEELNAIIKQMYVKEFQ